ncbi:hypothetical protein BJ165DRAFT_234526 [Panaeolus papilionaceus]|nr:hypothetical protein BJ165DRAFT_234526 [Panaeolus papilionaceus]
MAPIRSPCLYSSNFSPLNRALAPKGRNSHSLDEYPNDLPGAPSQSGRSTLLTHRIEHLRLTNIRDTDGKRVASDLHQGCLVLDLWYPSLAQRRILSPPYSHSPWPGHRGNFYTSSHSSPLAAYNSKDRYGAPKCHPNTRGFALDSSTRLGSG